MNPKNIRQELCEQYGYTIPIKYVAIIVNIVATIAARR